MQQIKCWNFTYGICICNNNSNNTLFTASSEHRNRQTCTGSKITVLTRTLRPKLVKSLSESIPSNVKCSDIRPIYVPTIYDDVLNSKDVTQYMLRMIFLFFQSHSRSSTSTSIESSHRATISYITLMFRLGLKNLQLGFASLTMTSPCNMDWDGHKTQQSDRRSAIMASKQILLSAVMHSGSKRSSFRPCTASSDDCRHTSSLQSSYSRYRFLYSV